MKLHTFFRSSASHRVRIALAYKGVPAEHVHVHLFRAGGGQFADAYRAKNPMAQLPLLEVTGPDGVTRSIAQSMAILEYLEEAFPEPRLLPADLFLRAKARQLAEIVNSGIQPFQNLSVTRYVRDQLAGDDRAFTHHFVGVGLAALEREVAGSAGRFCVGDAPTFADVFLVPQLAAARRLALDITGLPTLLRVEEACVALPAFAAAHPDAQPDAEPPAAG